MKDRRGGIVRLAICEIPRGDWIRCGGSATDLSKMESGERYGMTTSETG